MGKEKYEIKLTKYGKEIMKYNENFTVKDLNDLLKELIKEGKEDYTVTHEAFCCGSNWISIDNTQKAISLD